MKTPSVSAYFWSAIGVIVVGICVAPAKADEHLMSQIRAMVEREEVARYVGAARKGSSQDWVRVKVEPEPLRQNLGVRFFRAYNQSIDPPISYVVAVNADGDLYPIGGFRESKFSLLVKRWASEDRPLTESSVQTVISDYFRMVEGWQPGIVDSVNDRVEFAEASKFASRCVCTSSAHERPVRIQVLGQGAARMKGLLLDAASSRLECVDVEMSAAKGLVIVSREVLVDVPRTQL